MAHANISVFIPHMGCPHTCSFCNQRTISSTQSPPSAQELDGILKKAMEDISSSERRAQTEIAFFGGSFTAIPREYMRELLETAYSYVRQDKRDGFFGIRISTRPDCIDEEILMLLKEYGVTAIELGAQSMSDRVLMLNERGHTAADVKRSARLIKDFDFELGLQLMVGLYGSSCEDELYSMNEIISCKPDTVRIYPVAVLKGTRLAELYEQGEYRLYPFEQCVGICAQMYETFTRNGIRIIRMGLHSEDGVGNNCVAGFYHPAFGELVRSEIIRRIIGENLISGENICEAPPRLMSALVGHKRSNREYFSDKNVRFKENKTLPCNVITVNGRQYEV